MKRIVLIAGFESFNAGLYRECALLAQKRCPELDIQIFSDRDISSSPKALEVALQDAEVFFGKSDKAKDEDFIKYGLAHQLEWDKALG